MPSRAQTLRHVFNGGWATDFGDEAEVAINGGLVQVPFLAEALNVTFLLDGGTHKIGGTTKMNSTVANSGAEIIGLVDYWKGAGSTPSQKIVIHSGQDILAADMDGNFSSVKGSLVDDAVPNYNTFDDLLIIASDATDNPQKYNQSTCTDLSASATSIGFAFTETHKNRVWAAGDTSNPSRLYYSAHVDPEDWSGAGSGFIDIDPNDGDSITALASHKDNLWVFKGPYKGSIHRIIGSAPTGSDSFGRQTFMRGIGAVWQNTIFRFRDDLGFMWSDGSIHSLAATAAYGDFNEAALSRPINSWIRDRVNAGRLKYAWAATDSVLGRVIFTMPINSSTTNNIHLMMDYRFDPPRWSRWNAYDSGAIAAVVDGNFQQIFSSGNDGFVRKTNRSGRSLDTGDPIGCSTVLPFLSYGTPHNKKQLSRVSFGVNPIADHALDFRWTRDNNNVQRQSMTQGGSGTALGSFMLDFSRLGGSSYLNRFMSLEEGGEFRAVQMSVSNANFDEDLELHNIGVTLRPGADSGEN